MSLNNLQQQSLQTSNNLDIDRSEMPTEWSIQVDIRDNIRPGRPKLIMKDKLICHFFFSDMTLCSLPSSCILTDQVICFSTVHGMSFNMRGISHKLLTPWYGLHRLEFASRWTLERDSFSEHYCSPTLNLTLWDDILRKGRNSSRRSYPNTPL